jgi:hypothetical protein
MRHPSHPRFRSGPLFTTVAILIASLAWLAGGPARADRPSPHRHELDRGEIRDVLRSLGRVPERIHRDHERHLQVFFDSRQYDRRHRHDHDVYRFPVRIDGAIEYRPYSYCDGRLYDHRSSRPRLWVEWSLDRNSRYDDRYDDRYDRDRRHRRDDRDDRRDRRGRRDDRYDDRYERRGRYDRDDHYRHERSIPPGHLPPPGKCRVWYDDRPPGHQPPPTSCDSAHRAVRRYGGRVIYGGPRH